MAPMNLRDFCYQTKPLIRLQADIDQETGQRTLTCYLLPQQPTQLDGLFILENMIFTASETILILCGCMAMSTLFLQALCLSVPDETDGDTKSFHASVWEEERPHRQQIQFELKDLPCGHVCSPRCVRCSATSHSHHLYADDTHLFTFFISKIFSLVINSFWTSANRLTLKPSKTEFMVINLPAQLSN